MRAGSVPCEECARIARALRDAWRADNRTVRARLEDVARASGRDPQQVDVSWVFSIAVMPDHEMAALLESHYPRLARARRDRNEHETESGHSVYLYGCWSRYGPDELE